jgi:hypothetical protein
MAEPVTGLEQKLRAFETPLRSTIAGDQIFLADGPITGPVHLTTPDLASELNRSLPLSQQTTDQMVNPLMPVVSGLPGSRTTELIPMSEVTSEFYLGPKSSPPVANNRGAPLQPGNTYFNVNDQSLYIWSNAGRWVPAGAAFPAVPKVYYYVYTIDSDQCPPGGPGSPDSNGNVLSFEVAGGQKQVDLIHVYMNGSLLVNGADYTVHEGGTIGDYILFTRATCVQSVVVVQVYQANSQTTFTPNAVKLNTSGWVFNGDPDTNEGNVTFPMVNMAGVAVFPGSAVNMLVSYNSQILEPNDGFTINGDEITFVPIPAAGTDIWVVVGLPTAGDTDVTLGGAPFTPREMGAVGDGVADDTVALANAITRMLNTGRPLNLSNGTWRITSPLPVMNRAAITGDGSGDIYVDFKPTAPILNINVALVDTWTVTAIAVVTFDFNGAFTADSTMTRLTLTPSLTATPPVGSICKLTATDALVGVEAGDQVGQHVYIAAVSGAFAYVSNMLADSYTTGMQLHQLGDAAVDLRGFGVRANVSRFVVEDWLFEFIRIMGAINPRSRDLVFSDGVQALTHVGCWKPQTRGVNIRRMRNATASETPPVPGYGVVDGGCFMPSHNQLDGEDCRHIYTTISPDAATWARVAWGRTIKPTINGGKGVGCSAAAYDTHSDCLEPTFANLDVYGGYFGENSAGAGLQFKGSRGIMSNCRVRDCAVGFEIYKQFAGEGGGHLVDGCTYIGSGTPIRIDRDPGLSAVNAQQTCRLRDFHGDTTGQIGIDASDCDLVVEGLVRIIHSGSQTSVRALYQRAASTVRSYGDGRLVHVITGMVSPATAPRLITFKDASCGANGLFAAVRAGSVAWQAVVSEDETVAVAVPAGAFRIDCDTDLAPNTASGGFSLNGAGGLLPASALSLKLTLNGGRSLLRTGGFTLTTAMHSSLILCQGTFTITIPSGAVLGPEFYCLVFCSTGTVTLDGPGGTNPTVAAGAMVRVQVLGSAVTSVPFNTIVTL